MHVSKLTHRQAPMLLTVGLALWLMGCAGSPTSSSSVAPTSTGTCTGRATPAQTEGPYFKAGSPERTSLLEPGMAGTRLTITGRVFTASCTPVARALLDFWQADSAGIYDNIGYRLRGHQFTDATGAYSLQTIVPGEYPGRTAHIHVKVQAPGKSVLTTQLYFPGENRNQQDSIFNAALLMDVQDSADGRVGAFTFVFNAP